MSDDYEQLTKEVEGEYAAGDERVGEVIAFGKSKRTQKIGVAVAAVVIALLSFFVLSGVFSDPSFYKGTVESLDGKRNVVMGLMASSAGASAVASAIPLEAGKPIAEKLADLSYNFMLILAAIYLEKYLLTVFGLAAFKVLIPLACILFAIGFALHDESLMKEKLYQLSKKAVLLGAALVLVVPASVQVSNAVEKMQEELYSTKATTQSEVSKEAEEAAQGIIASEAAGSDSAPLDVGKMINNVVSGLNDAGKAVTEKANELVAEAATQLNNLFERFAVMVVTSCVLPILVLCFFVWIVNMIMGINVSLPTRAFRPMGRAGKK